MTNKELEEFNKHRKIWQICAVTNDLERTMQQWVDKLKIGPWKVRSFNSENMDYEYVGDRMLDKEKEPWEFRIGITMVGDFEIEIIQPVKGPTIFQDWLDRHGEGIHHLKRRLPMRKSCKKPWRSGLPTVYPLWREASSSATSTTIWMPKSTSVAFTNWEIAPLLKYLRV